MATKLEKRFTPKYEETPPPPGVPTLKTKNCFVCGTSECFNGTTVDHEGEKYLVRVCNNDKCKQAVRTVEGVKKIADKNLLTPSQHKNKNVEVKNQTQNKNQNRKLTVVSK